MNTNEIVKEEPKSLEEIYEKLDTELIFVMTRRHKRELEMMNKFLEEVRNENQTDEVLKC